MYIEKNDYIVRCAYDSIGREGLQRFLCVDFMDCVGSMIGQAEALAGQTLEPGYREFLCRFYRDAIAGMLIEWIKNRKQYDKDTVIDYVSVTIRRSLMGIFQVNSKDK